MPAVTVFSKPNGEPMASTHSPTLICAGSPSFTTGRPLASIFTTAMSVALSAPTTLPLNSRRSMRRTRTSSAPSTTCALVRMVPSASTMKPEPMPWRGCCGNCGIRRRSSSGRFSRPSGALAPGFGAEEEVMLTTAPLFASAIAAKSGSVWTAAAAGGAAVADAAAVAG